MRKSSRGNPWHDSRGRFCSGPQGGGVKSERTPEEYEQRTQERMESASYIVNKDGTYGLTSSKEIQEGMIVEYTPAFCGEGEEKYVHMVKEFRMDPVTGDPKGRAVIETLNSKSILGHTELVSMEMIQPAPKKKVDAASEEYDNKMRKPPMRMPPMQEDGRFASRPKVAIAGSPPPPPPPSKGDRCPKCGALMKGGVCPKCGYGKPKETKPKDSTKKSIKEQISKFATDDYQNRNGGYPRSGVPDSIRTEEWNGKNTISFDFKNTSPGGCESFVKRWCRENGIEFSDIETYEGDDSEFADDWNTTTITVSGVR